MSPTLPNYTRVRLLIAIDGYPAGSLGTIIDTHPSGTAYMIEMAGSTDIDGIVDAMADEVDAAEVDHRARLIALAAETQVKFEAGELKSFKGMSREEIRAVLRDAL